MLKIRILCFLWIIGYFLSPLALARDNVPPPGFISLFNGKDFTGWKVPEGDNGHWKIINGVIDYDAQSESDGNKNLWTQNEFGNFTLLVDWKIKSTPFTNTRVPIVLPDGTHKLDETGKPIRISVPDSDSGVYVRGQSKAQVNIWCWPIGSGEVYGYRMDQSMPDSVRAGVTPLTNADNNLGEWNTFRITVEGNLLTVVLNNKIVLDKAQLPDLPVRGPMALQHHGSMREGKWVSPPALVQFKNIFIKEF